VFTVAALVIGKYYYDFNKKILEFGDLTMSFDGHIESGLEYQGTAFTDLYEIISGSLPNFSTRKDISYLSCSVYVSDFDMSALPGLVSLWVFYLLLPLSVMWLKPIKRGLYRFWHIFWIADREVFCSSGLVCQQMSIEEVVAKVQDGEEEAWMAGIGVKEKKVWDDSVESLLRSLYDNDATWMDVNYVRRTLNQRLDELTALLCSAEERRRVAAETTIGWN